MKSYSTESDCWSYLVQCSDSGFRGIDHERVGKCIVDLLGGKPVSVVTVVVLTQILLWAILLIIDAYESWTVPTIITLVTSGIWAAGKKKAFRERRWRLWQLMELWQRVGGFPVKDPRVD